MSMGNETSNDGAADSAEIREGYGHAYRYLDPRSQLCEITADRAEAERLSGGSYEEVRVHFTAGLIDRVISGGSDGAVGESAPSFLEAHEEWKGTEAAGAGEEPAGDAQRHEGGGVHHSRIAHPDRPENGMGLAYRYIDSETGFYGWTPDETKAALAAGEDYKTFWVVYRDGHIDHAASIGEWRGELDLRVGEQISDGLPQAKLNEFDLIEDQAEATRWLEDNRPDYRDIARRTCKEMTRGLVMEDGAAKHPEY